MSKLSAPAINRTLSRGGLGQNSPFNEGVQVPEAAFKEIAERKPALLSKDAHERSEAMRREILSGELAPYRRR